jgi:hypothetical protein
VALVAAVSAALALGLAGSAAPAMASGGPPHEVCDTSITEQCLNDWNGTGQWVRTYQIGAGNNYFEFQGIDRCITGSDKTTPTCPFQLGSGLNEPNWIVGQFVDETTQLCVGDDPANNGATYEDGCNFVSSGMAGGTGTVYVQIPPSFGTDCPAGWDAYASIHWSNGTNGYLQLGWAGSGNGQTVANNLAGRYFCLRAA